MTAVIPDSHRDLIEGPISVALTTVMPDGQPQTTVVWCNTDGTHVLINTMTKFQKAKNMQRNPKVTLFAFERHKPLRYIEVRGTVIEMTEVGAMEHLDELAELYVGKSPYFGEVLPAEWKDKETPLVRKIIPTHVVAEDFK